MQSWRYLTLARATLLIVLVSSVAGCGGKKIKLVPVEGKLTIKGRPARNISVQFLPDAQNGNQGPTSMGVTDEEGKFTLNTTDGRVGAVAGEHLVVLSDLEEERVAQGSVAKLPRLDTRFSIPAQKSRGGLTVTVPEGGGQVELVATPPRR